MGAIVSKNNPCEVCGSHDAKQIYDDASAFCFSCSHYFPQTKNSEAEDASKTLPVATRTRTMPKETIEDIKKYKSRGFADRKISKMVCEFFDVKVSYDNDGTIDAHYYPYSNGGYKKRQLPKTFTFIGKSGGLFGKDKFQGGGKRLVITEGEIDALSVAEATFKKYNKFYPVISLPSATGTKEALENRDWIRSFQEVVLCLDNDDPGKEATKKLIKIIGLDKVKLWNPLDCKDANEVLIKHGELKINQYIWDAAPFIPTGFVGKEALWDALSKLNDTVSVPYPKCLEGINTKLKGMRLGEIALFISGTGSGKSTMLREIMLHLLETTKTKIGIISLEESPAETARKLAGMQLQRNPSNEEIPLTELKVGFDKVFGEDRVLVLDHQGSIKDSSIVEQMEYMCLMECEYIFVDHITILVSEGADGLEGNAAIDLVMNHLLRLVKKHPVWIGLVSHLRKAQSGKTSFEEGRLPSIDDIRGSGSIKQVSFDIVAFARDLMATDDKERNTIKMAILKSRHTGLTGRVTGATYNHQTGRLTADIEQFEQL